MRHNLLRPRTVHGLRVRCGLVVLLAGLAALPVLAAGAAAPVVRYANDGGAPTLTIEPGPVRWTAGQGDVFPELAGFGRLEEPGRPDLPVRVERIAVEPGGGVILGALDVEWSEGLIPGAIAPFPALDPRRPALRDARASGWWPVEPVRVVREDGAFRTLHFAEVAIAPLQVDLATGRFRVARRLVVHFERRSGLRASAPVAASASAAPADLLLDDVADAIAHGAAEVSRGSAVTPVLRTNALANAPLAPDAAPTYPAWQFEVKAEGLVRITYEWAQANQPALFTFLTSNDPRRYRLTVQQIVVPLRVTGESDGVFGPGDALVFYGQPVGANDLFSPDLWQRGQYASGNVYRLDVATGVTHIATDATSHGVTNGWAVAPSFRSTARREDNGLFLGFVPTDGVDHWYVNPLLNASCKDTSVTTCSDPLPASYCQGDPLYGGTCSGGALVCCGAAQDLSVATPDHAGGSVSVRTRLLGFSYPNNGHRSELYVNGTLRNTADWDGYTEFTQGVDNGAVSFTPASALGTSTTVRVRLPLGRTVTGANPYKDIVGENWVEIDYDRLYRGLNDALLPTVTNANRQVQLANFSASPEVWDVTDSVTSPDGMAIAQPKRVAGVAACAAGQCFEIDADGARPATRRFAAAGPNGYALPSAVREDKPPSTLDASLGSSLKGAGLGADWVVIGDRSLLNMTAGSRLRDLVARRQGQGLKTAVIDVQDVYDEFTDGLQDPEAIRRFMDWALNQHQWTPAPSYLVLVGDATRDYRNDLGHPASRQLVPTHMFDLAANTQLGYYLSDTWFTAVVGSDVMPDAVVGRIPAHTLAEAEEVFRKVVAYESGAQPPSWSGKACLVSEWDGPAGQPGDGTMFTVVHDQVWTSHYASGPQVGTKVYEATRDEDKNGLCSASAVERPMNARINACVNSGAGLISFVGHGGYKVWGKSSSFFSTVGPTDGACPTGPVDDMANIAAGTPLSFHLHANCITGHFSADDPVGSTNDSWYTFFEAWLLATNKGAIGGFSPSHLAYTQDFDSIITSFYDELWGPRKERTAAKLDMRIRSDMAAFNNVTGIRSFVYEGDPALRLAVPAPAPTTIGAITQNGSRTLHITWDAVPGAAGYRVYRSNIPDGTYTRAVTIPNGTTTAADDTNLVNCTEYYYYVVSVDAGGFESRWSNYNTTCRGDRSDCKFGTPQNPSGPPAPTIASVVDTQQGGQLLVTWNPPADPGHEIVQYRIGWSLTSGGPFVNTAIASAGANSLAIGGLTDRTTYYVQVRAENCSLPGAYSVPVAGTPHKVVGLNAPAAISDLRVTRSGASDLKLTWTLPTQTVWGTTTTVNSVEVYGDQTAPSFALDVAHRLGTVSAPGTTYTHVGAGTTTAKKWYYTVVAVDAGGVKSGGGDEAPDGTDTLRVTKITNTNLQLTWSPVTQDIKGRRTYVKQYNLYGQPTAFGRSSCTSSNRLLTCNCTTTNVNPANSFFAWQVLAEDAHSTEAIW